MWARSVVAVVALFLLRPCAGEELVFPVPGAPYDPRVPTLAALGGGWGEFSDPELIARYARAIAAAAPDRVRLEEIGRSVEGRPLLLLLLSSPANLSRLDDIRGALAAAGDPRRGDPAEGRGRLATLPAVVWLEGSVHGDEPSGGDALLTLAYVLAAGGSAEVARILDTCVVVIDPAQNPDGRARFSADLARAGTLGADGEPDGALHDFPWPGGRYSHHLFDLNRDWLAATHPETRARIAAMVDLPPTVVVDLHEMNADGGYFFPPPARPVHPFVARTQADLWLTVGKALARTFDLRGWRYWTRETFDAYYPGYGESWPALGGAAGFTFEQGGVDGRRIRLADESELTYRDAVEHHLVAAWTTCGAVAAEPGRYLEAWLSYRRAAVEEGQTGPARALSLTCPSPRQLYELADLLARHGIELYACTRPAAGDAVVVPLAQPLGRLARVLLERGAPLDPAFEAEQERRDARRQPDEIYDLTAWSLPLLWGVDVGILTALPPAGDLARIRTGNPPPGRVVGSGDVAYLARWDALPAARALAALLRAGAAVQVASRGFTLEGRRWDPGTLVVRRAPADPTQAAALERIAAASGVDFVRAGTAFADAGVDLGSNKVVRVRAPRVALAWDEPTRPSAAGAVRFALAEEIGYPVTTMRTVRLADADLRRFDVIVLPDAGKGYGGYAGVLGEAGVQRLKSWVDEGGVVIGIGEGAAFLCLEKVGLLSSSLATRSSEAKADEGKGAVKPTRGDDERPPAVPGAILRLELDAEELLAAGFAERRVAALVTSPRAFAPLPVRDGRNIGLYAPEASLVEAGFVLGASRAVLPGSAYLMVQPHGRGRVVAFAEDPAARGFARSTTLLLANAVFFAAAL